MIKKIKLLVEKIPYSIGSTFKYIPFRLRLGNVYSFFSKKITIFLESSDIQKEEFVVTNFNKAFQYAKKNFPFYNSLYKKHNVYDLEINSIEDISKLPIINKKRFISGLSGKLTRNGISVFFSKK